MLTVEPNDTTVQKIDLEMKITRLESETLEECKQRKEKEEARQKKEAEEAATTAERDHKRAEKEAEEEAQRVTKAAERDRKRAEKEAEEETQRALKAAERDAKWSAENNAMIVRMIDGGYSYDEIASKLGNDLTKMNIYHIWTDHLKESSGIIKPAVQPGQKVATFGLRRTMQRL
jgi:regulator of protease activity HflC (stomatin/prohibitin superfamily)